MVTPATEMSMSRPRNCSLGDCRLTTTMEFGLIVTASQTLHDHGNALTAANTEGGKAAVGTAALHFINQSRQDACAAGADRMAERDSAAVDVDALRIQAQFFDHRDGLCG